MSNLKYNIYQVTSEYQIDELFEHNKTNFFVLIFSARNTHLVSKELDCSIRKHVKRVLSPQQKDIIFLYIDLAHYESVPSRNTYTKNIHQSQLPAVNYFYNSTYLGYLPNAVAESIEITTKNVYLQIQEIVQKKKTLLSTPVENQNNTVNTQETENIKEDDVLPPEEIPESKKEDIVDQPPSIINTIKDNDDTIDDNKLPEKKVEPVKQVKQKPQISIEQLREQQFHYKQHEKIDELRQQCAIKEMDKIIKLKQK